MAIVTGGTNICGVSIGVLSLESYFPKPPGHIKNPSSMPFTLAYEVIEGLNVPKLLGNPSQDMLGPLIEAAQKLERAGVKAITGSCGFLALFQKEIAAAVSVPVAVSSLMLVPLIHRMTGRPVGIITASRASLTEAHLKAVGAHQTPVVIQGMEESDEFSEVILRGERTAMDLEIVEADLVQAGQALVDKSPEVGAILLECTDLPPYANSLQSATERPVFDIINLASMMHAAVHRRPFDGFIH